MGELETNPGMVAQPTDETIPPPRPADLKDRAAGFLRRFQKGQK
jgi:hypothetical protein